MIVLILCCIPYAIDSNPLFVPSTNRQTDLQLLTPHPFIVMALQGTKPRQQLQEEQCCQEASINAAPTDP